MNTNLTLQARGAALFVVNAETIAPITIELPPYRVEVVARVGEITIEP
jgi:hypothetical protein